jgi:tRNA(Arg) A34 adenosine deaminase TadA
VAGRWKRGQRLPSHASAPAVHSPVASDYPVMPLTATSWTGQRPCRASVAACLERSSASWRRRVLRQPPSAASHESSSELTASSSGRSFSDDDYSFMRLALAEARRAAAAGEVPVGAVLVAADGTVLAAAHNRVHGRRSPIAHAEILCLTLAASRLRQWRLLGTTLYVTVEPCPMCAGALLQSRVSRVVYGARQPRLGADGSWVQLFPGPEYVDGSSNAQQHPFHRKVVVESGCCADECANLMRAFFMRRRIQREQLPSEGSVAVGSMLSTMEDE